MSVRSALYSVVIGGLAATMAVVVADGVATASSAGTDSPSAAHSLGYAVMEVSIGSPVGTPHNALDSAHPFALVEPLLGDELTDETARNATSMAHATSTLSDDFAPDHDEEFAWPSSTMAQAAALVATPMATPEAPSTVSEAAPVPTSTTAASVAGVPDPTTSTSLGASTSTTPDTATDTSGEGTEAPARATTPTTPGSTATTSTGSAVPSTRAAGLLAAMNDERASAGLAPLTSVGDLSQLALIRSSDMVSNGYFSHISPTGESWISLLNDAKIRVKSGGENLARVSGDETRSVSVAILHLMDSPTHRANIINGNYNQVGVAAVTDEHGVTVFTAIFAHR